MSAPANEIRTRVTWKTAAAVLCAAFGMSTAPGNAQTANAPILEVPAHSVPVPSTVSPQMAKIIGLPLRTNWNVLPKTGEEWRVVADTGAVGTIKNLPGISERLKVKVEKTTMNGVRVFVVTPEVIAPDNRNRVLLHMHGGCYVL